jgi:hypothetical protein
MSDCFVLGWWVEGVGKGKGIPLGLDDEVEC